MRVAVFSEVYWPMVSGVGVTLRRISDGLAAQGHPVRVYSASYPLPSGHPDRPDVHRSPSVPLFLYPDVHWAFPRYRAVLEDVARFRPDVVHVATEFAMGVTGTKVARQLGVPVVASAHTDYEKYAGRYNLDWFMRAGWRYLRWFYRQTAMVLSPSRQFDHHLRRRGVWNTAIWSRGVDADRFHPSFRSEEFRRQLGLAPGDLLVSYVGRIAKEKNLELLVEAWRGLAPENARLMLVGRGPLEQDLRRMQVPGLLLPGMMEGPQLAAAYASSDIFAFPSTTETFGNVLLEAMASGLPCLSASEGGVLEFARHGENAWLVPATAGSLTDGLGRLAADPALRAHLARGARATALGRAWGPVLDALVQHYRSAANGVARAA